MRKAWAEAKEAWQSLYDPARHTFFLSWHWVAAWLHVLPSQFSPYLLVVERNGVVLFACVIGHHRPLAGAVKACVGEVDDDYYDDLVIEQNGFLLHPDATLPDLQQLLLAAGIDVLSLSKSSDEFLQRATTGFNLITWRQSERSVTTYYVDLQTVRASEQGYLGLLSRNRRAQIRKSLRLYEAEATMECEVATSLPQANAFFAELTALHQAEWQARGQRGTFANTFNHDFHTRLLNTAFESGQIALYRFRVGGRTIGVIYGFISCGEFLYYQSGFAYAHSNQFRPGLVCHSRLIGLLAEQGLQRYDFLAGESDYKRSLSTNHYLTQSWLFYSGSLRSRVAHVWQEQCKPGLRQWLRWWRR